MGARTLTDSGDVWALTPCSQEEIRWFRDEIAIHKKLRHPNICTLHGAFEDLRKFTMVLSLCQGGSLCDTLNLCPMLCPRSLGWDTLSAARPHSDLHPAAGA